MRVESTDCLLYSSMYLPLSLISPFPPLLFDSLISSLLSGYFGRPTFQGRRKHFRIGQAVKIEADGGILPILKAITYKSKIVSALIHPFAL